MTRLALAETIVLGTVTLQGMSYSFTASASETATGSNVSNAKKAATVASNAAAVKAARASIDQILLDNSALLPELEITSLISNNLSTTVKVYRPIALETISTTTDGINYFVTKATTIRANQWLIIPNGKTLTFNAPSKNYGYFQIGEGPTSLPNSNLKGTTTAAANYNSDVSNYGFIVVYTTCNIACTITNAGEYSQFINLGTTNLNSGSILNAASVTGVVNGSTSSTATTTYADFNIASGAAININGENSFVLNSIVGVMNNSGTVACNKSNGTSVYPCGTWNGNAWENCEIGGC
jgi:hypothetical protein